MGTEGRVSPWENGPGEGPGCAGLGGDVAGHGSPGGSFSLGGLGCGADGAGERKAELAVMKWCPACAGAAPQRAGAGPSVIPKRFPKLHVGLWGCRAVGWLHSPPPFGIARGDCGGGQRADGVSCVVGQKWRQCFVFLGLENRVLWLILGLRNRRSCVALGSETEVKSCIFGT